NGDAGPYAPLARLMSDRFTVVSYDRRGFSRSPMDEVPEDRLGVDVADALALIDVVGERDAAAYVFGSSSGAIVGLELLARHPERVRMLVAHEPPLMSILPDGDEILAFFDEVVEISRRDGVEAATAAFGARMGMDGDAPDVGTLPGPVAEMLERMWVNQPFFLEHELRQYPAVMPDYARLQAQSAKIVLVGGRESRDYPPYRPNLVLGERLARPVLDLPGDHVGYVTAAPDFAAALSPLLPDDGDGAPE
ncbi:MAG TPA: alpha/beta hydrolase, partial [Micromonosporaceae bacterium]